MATGNEEKILAYVRGLRNAGPSVTADTDLIASGVLDSLAVMELIAFLSKSFGVRIPASKITPANLRSVVTLSALVAAQKT